MLFSIIIPVKSINDYVRETVSHIQAIKNGNWELLILPNDPEFSEWSDERISIISSGSVGPAKKRDIGAALAIGEILVFIDDDSYPNPDFLTVGKQYFENESVVALGGPAITPPSDSFWQRVSGAFFLSYCSGGVPERYVPIGNVRPIKDWPSVNLMVRRTEFIEIGGFNSPYWPGEDTKLCLDLIQKTGKTILYVPEMRVWHHRREGLSAHLRQIGAYGLHRGYFAKVYPNTSRRLTYFMPSFFLVFVGATVVIPLYSKEAIPYFMAGWGLYLAALSKAWADMCKYENPVVSFVAIGYTILSHIWYGARFLQGLFTNNLVSRLR